MYAHSKNDSHIRKLTFKSKWFLQSLGLDGLNKMLDPYEDRSAEAVCTFAFSHGPGAQPILFQGRTLVSYQIQHKNILYTHKDIEWGLTLSPLSREKSSLHEDQQSSVRRSLLFPFHCVVSDSSRLYRLGSYF